MEEHPPRPASQPGGEAERSDSFFLTGTGAEEKRPATALGLHGLGGGRPSLPRLTKIPSFLNYTGQILPSPLPSSIQMSSRSKMTFRFPTAPDGKVSGLSHEANAKVERLQHLLFLYSQRIEADRDAENRRKRLGDDKAKAIVLSEEDYKEFDREIDQLLFELKGVTDSSNMRLASAQEKAAEVKAMRRGAVDSARDVKKVHVSIAKLSEAQMEELRLNRKSASVGWRVQRKVDKYRKSKEERAELKKRVAIAVKGKVLDIVQSNTVVDTPEERRFWDLARLQAHSDHVQRVLELRAIRAAQKRHRALEWVMRKEERFEATMAERAAAKDEMQEEFHTQVQAVYLVLVAVASRTQVMLQLHKKLLDLADRRDTLSWALHRLRKCFNRYRFVQTIAKRVRARRTLLFRLGIVVSRWKRQRTAKSTEVVKEMLQLTNRLEYRIPRYISLFRNKICNLQHIWRCYKLRQAARMVVISRHFELVELTGSRHGNSLPGLLGRAKPGGQPRSKVRDRFQAISRPSVTTSPPMSSLPPHIREKFIKDELARRLQDNAETLSVWRKHCLRKFWMGSPVSDISTNEFTDTEIAGFPASVARPQWPLVVPDSEMKVLVNSALGLARGVTHAPLKVPEEATGWET